MKILYFAWLRERIGVGEEEITLPQSVNTSKDLVDWLVKRGPGYSAAFEDLSIVRIAVNMEFSDLKHIVTNEDEVAFFPPVTGGNRMEKIFD